MQDDRAARLLVGRIAELDVESLELRPQEMAAPRDRGRREDAEAAPPPPLALFRMDFAARVRTAEGGLRQVLIEIQKTNAPTVMPALPSMRQDVRDGPLSAPEDAP